MLRKKQSIGIIGILICLVLVCGCTSSAPSVKGPYPDIKLANTPSPYLLSDGSSYMVGGLIKNTGQSTYNNVLLKISGLNNQGQVVSSKETMIANLPPGATGDYQVFLDVPSNGDKIVGADIEVVSANKS